MSKSGKQTSYYVRRFGVGMIVVGIAGLSLRVTEVFYFNIPFDFDAAIGYASILISGFLGYLVSNVLKNLEEKVEDLRRGADTGKLR